MTNPARDRISIRRIGIFAYHGVFEEEARLGQRFYISIDAQADLSAAGRSDDLSQSVSYADLAMRVQEIAVSDRFQILEALAERIAGDLLSEFPRITEITVTVEKPGAAIAALFDGLSISITRTRA